MLLSLLATAGISFAKGLIEDHGEDLVKEGIKKVTGIDLEGKTKLTSEETDTINSYKIQLEELDFKKLQLEYEADKEDNRHEEAKYNKAHDTYQINHDMADVIAKRIIERNLPYIAVLVSLNLVLIYYMKTEVALLAIASNIIGITIGNLFAERQAIVNFFFGSSIGSKQKSEMLKGK